MRIARQFGREFFDGERRHGYGGYSASADRWRGVVDDIIATYGEVESFLDIGCGKGGLVRAMKDRLPNCECVGIDVSTYAIECALEAHPDDVDFDVMDVRNMDLWTRFDLAVSINTVHNLHRHGVIHALEDISEWCDRSYITVDTYRNEEERQRMFGWNLTALTILSTDEWKALFEEAGYTGDYGWFVP